MKKINSFYLIALAIFFICPSGTGQYNPTLTINNPSTVSTDGNVAYSTTSISSGDARFTLYGNGFFGNQNSFSHQFESDATGFQTSTFFNRRYKPVKPTKRLISTGSTGAGARINGKIRMPSNANSTVGISWYPVQAIENYFILTFENKSSSPEDGCIEFYYSNDELNLNFSGILDYDWAIYKSNPNVTGSSLYNKKLKWEFKKLKPGEQRVIYIPMTSLKSKGTKLYVGSKYISGCTGGGSSSSGASGVSGTTTMSMGSPHDPNVKFADKECVSPSVQNFQSLVYTVRFQNEGTGPAVNVLLVDLLDDINLDLSTFSIIDSEYSYTYNIIGNELRILFPNINLPGLKQSGPETYSYDDTESFIQFSICTHRNLNPGAIYNYVDIYFDSQPVVKTDISVVDIIDNCVFSPSLTSCAAAGYKTTNTNESIDSEITIYPNPIQEVLYIEGLGEQEVVLNIFNNRGELITSRSGISSSTNSVDLEDLASGMYFIQIKNKAINITKKVVKL